MFNALLNNLGVQRPTFSGQPSPLVVGSHKACLTKIGACVFGAMEKPQGRFLFVQFGMKWRLEPTWRKDRGVEIASWPN